MVVLGAGAEMGPLSALLGWGGTVIGIDLPQPAFLATPTDTFAVPGDAVAQSNQRYRDRSRRARLTDTLSGGRLLQPNYPEGADPGINDSLVAQQGPNYALAKRIQRWRASLARRTPYHPRSALGLAAIRGLPAALR